MSTKPPFRVAVTHTTPNPNYVPGSNRSRSRHPDIQSRTYEYFDTLDEAKTYRDGLGYGAIGALSASGKSYQHCGV